MSGDDPCDLHTCEQHRKELRRWVENELAEIRQSHRLEITELKEWLVRVEEKIDTNNKELSGKIDHIKWYLLGLVIALLLATYKLTV